MLEETVDIEAISSLLKRFEMELEEIMVLVNIGTIVFEMFKGTGRRHF